MQPVRFFSALLFRLRAEGDHQVCGICQTMVLVQTGLCNVLKPLGCKVAPGAWERKLLHKVVQVVPCLPTLSLDHVHSCFVQTEQRQQCHRILLETPCNSRHSLTERLLGTHTGSHYRLRVFASDEALCKCTK